MIKTFDMTQGPYDPARSTLKMPDDTPKGTVIKIIGVGNAGGSVIARMIRNGVRGADFIAVDTDLQALAMSGAPVQISLDFTGMGSGVEIDQGRAAVEITREKIRKALTGAHMVLIVAGMGGGAGTSASPIVASVAKELGIFPTVGVVTKPLLHEGHRRMKVAEDGIAELSKQVHSVIVIGCENLYAMMGEDATQEACFKAADDTLGNACASIAGVIGIKSMMNVDFEDVRTIMGERGQALVGTAIAGGKNRAREAVEKAIACPLLESVDLNGARGALISIIASHSIKMKEAHEIMNIIQGYVAEDATVKFGIVFDDTMGENLRVMVIVTDLGGNNDIDPLPPHPLGPQRKSVSVFKSTEPAAYFYL